MSESCSTCRNRLRSGATENGVCRANPPAVFLRGTNEQGNPFFTSVFPPIQAEGWCGMWADAKRGVH